MLKTRNTSIQTETDDIFLDHRLDASLGNFLEVWTHVRDIHQTTATPL